MRRIVVPNGDTVTLPGSVSLTGEVDGKVYDALMKQHPQLASLFVVTEVEEEKPAKAKLPAEVK